MAAPRASATTVCYPRAEMLSYIAREYRGIRRAHGVDRPFNVMEIWTSPIGGRWIMISTDMEQRTCIVAQGDGLKIVPTLEALSEPPAG
ncbi:MAG: hypothetical protein AAF667_10275 [Pseudomonadota bacterium]